MKTHALDSTTAPGATAVHGFMIALSCSLLVLSTSAAAGGKPGGTNNKKDIPVEVILDDNHTDLFGVPTGVPNGITDDGAIYSNDSLLSAAVGRNANIWLYLNNSGRSLSIDLSQALGSSGSVPVDLVNDLVSASDVTIIGTQADGVCDYCYHDPGNPEPLRPQPPAGSLEASDARFEIASGEDLDDLFANGDCQLETNARLWFSANGSEWRLTWGPRQIPGGWMPNPRADPILLSRTNQATMDGQSVPGNFWFFQTTGDHLATLFRRPSNASGNYFEYYGQFRIPYSGFVRAETYDANLTGNHCDLRIPNIGAGLVPSVVTLEHDQSGGNDQLVATALDQCDDFSAAPASFDWYVDGNLSAAATGNTFDLPPYSDAIITVFATHPEWLAKLPNLVTILQAEVEGTAQFVRGGGGGESMSLAPLAWSYPRGGKDIKVVLTIVDATGAALAGIDVTATLDGPAGSGVSEPVVATTDGNGQVSKKIKDAPAGQWCVNVIDVQDPGGISVWDGVAPNPNCVTR